MKLLLAALLSLAALVSAGQVHDPRTHAVDIRGLQFLPAELEVAAGDTVVFTNYDLVPHTVDEKGGGFESGGLSQNAATRFVASEPGVFEYLCAYHPTMKGILRVQ